MNKQIRELIDQAISNPRFDDLDKVYIMNESDIEKFAELLILECDKFVTSNFHSAGWTLGYKIKKHFGVNDESC
jgi:hypothetical protein